MERSRPQAAICGCRETDVHLKRSKETVTRSLFQILKLWRQTCIWNITWTVSNVCLFSLTYKLEDAFMTNISCSLLIEQTRCF